MVNYCRVIGCTNRSDRERDRQFFRLPAIVTNQGEDCKRLSEKRRRQWLTNLNQDFTDKNIDNIRVCSDHFLSKKRASLYPPDHPDWVPHLNIGTDKIKSPEIIGQRFKRKHDRNRRSEAAKTLLFFSAGGAEDVPCEIDAQTEPETGEFSQTDVCGPLLDSINEEMQTLRTENLRLKSSESRHDKFAQTQFDGNDDKVRYFTGLTNYTTMSILFMTLEPFLPIKLSLCKFKMFIMTLMRLRLNLSNQFLSYEFDVSASTVSRIFTDVINVMYIRLKQFVLLPDRDVLRLTMPMQFRKHFGTKCAVIIDCFEVFIERPSNLKTRAESWSSYKHHNTVKFLLGITPQGTISYISNSWGGRVSDKHITDNCGFLNKLLPGDLVLADRGFDIQSSVGSMCAELQIPAFTKGRAQLSPLNVETTRKLANVRIHVERVIGLVRQKYTVLSGTLPIDLLMCKEGDWPIIDKVAFVCCALVNMCDSVVNLN